MPATPITANTHDHIIFSSPCNGYESTTIKTIKKMATAQKNPSFIDGTFCVPEFHVFL